MIKNFLLAGVLAGLLAVTGCGSEKDDGAAALVAARTEATNFFSIDYRHPEKDVDRVLALATGSFKKEYAAQRDQIIDGVKQKKLVVTATIPDQGAALEYLTEDKAQVLVAVDVSKTASTGGATVDRYRTRLVLTRVDDRWLVSALNQVG